MIATASAEPLDDFHRDIDQRILATKKAVATLRSGGTAMEVREAMIELGDVDVAHLRTVRRDLRLLYRLGNVSFKETEQGVRVWKAVDGAAPRTNVS